MELDDVDVHGATSGQRLLVALEYVLSLMLVNENGCHGRRPHARRHRPVRRARTAGHRRPDLGQN
ncbi:hypothetical protein ACH4YO_14510 [Streptomyces noursei]|uniref:hypothetical protein n=1 Tax=Streptomyces noursei TaxID=1971 RepID=UPI00340D33C7